MLDPKTIISKGYELGFIKERINVVPKVYENIDTNTLEFIMPDIHKHFPDLPDDIVFDFIVISPYGLYGKYDNKYYKKGVFKLLKKDYDLNYDYKIIEDLFDKSLYFYFIEVTSKYE